MPDKPPPITRSKSVITPFIFTIFFALYAALDAVSNAEFVLQKLGLSEAVSKFLGSSRGIQGMFWVSVVGLLISIMYHLRRYENFNNQIENTNTQLKDNLFATPEYNLTAKADTVATPKLQEKPENPSTPKTPRAQSVLSCLGAKIIKVNFHSNKQVYESERQDFEALACIAEFYLEPIKDAYSSISVKAVTYFQDLDNDKKMRINDGIWLKEKGNYKDFHTGESHKLVIAVYGQKVFAYEHELEQYRGGVMPQYLLIPKLHPFDGKNFQIEVELIGKRYNDIVLNERFKFGLATEPELKFEEIKAGQEFQFVSAENPEKRKYKIDRLRELISEGEKIFAPGYIPVTQRALEKEIYNESYKPRVEKFLEQYFGDSYVQRFQENEETALEEFLKELLDS
jgi:hypothetical protein